MAYRERERSGGGWGAGQRGVFLDPGAAGRGRRAPRTLRPKQKPDETKKDPAANQHPRIGTTAPLCWRGLVF
jgi:hypothetical protein